MWSTLDPGGKLEEFAGHEAAFHKQTENDKRP